MPKIIVLDGYVANPGDLEWEELYALGDVKIYDRTPSNLIIDRAKDADVILTNKCILDQSIINELTKLKYIGLLATGYNNIDITAAKSQKVVVCNAVGYSSPSVAQHVFALLLELTNHVSLHSRSVHNNDWGNAKDWCYWNKPLIELEGKTLGVYGLGAIGKQVAKIGMAFGMKVIATRKNQQKLSLQGVVMVTEDQLFSESDVLSLHAPLSVSNQNIINASVFKKMKPSAFLINTGRGGLINEEDLKIALEKKQIAGAALDVLKEEPPRLDHHLLNVPNCLITPHHAWASKESRQRMIAMVVKNLKAFLDGKPVNYL